MTQVSKYPIPNSVYQRIVNIFFKTLIEIKTNKEAQECVSNLLTPTEQIMVAKRLAIAFLLEKNYDYRTISKILRVSLTTIARVNLLRKYGEGYQKMIKKLMAEEQINDFLLGVGEALTGIAGLRGKGSGVWRYLHQELKKKREKPF